MGSIKGRILIAIAIVIGVGIAVYWSWGPSPGQRPVLRVHAYSTFLSPFGPGPRLKALFEARCDCVVELVNTGDGGLLVQRLKMAPEESVDVVVGLDQFTIGAAEGAIPWRELKTAEGPWEKEVAPFFTPRFAPFDWAPLAILYRDGEGPQASSWRELIERAGPAALSLQDPRTSTPGLQWLHWLRQESGPTDFAPLLARLRDKVHSFSPSWSGSYSLFQSGVAVMTFSYLTSLVYHWRDQGDRRYRAMEFAEGHPIQVEYVGLPATGRHAELAQGFVDFLLGAEAQRVIMEKNFMYPARAGLLTGTEYERLPRLKLRPVEALSVEFQKDMIQSWKESVP